MSLLTGNINEISIRAMTLKEWLSETKTTQATLAAQVGLTQGRISQIVASGTRDLETALRIQRATDHVVMWTELVPPDFHASVTEAVAGVPV